MPDPESAVQHTDRQMWRDRCPWQACAVRPTLWNIRLVIETDDEKLVQAKVDEIAGSMCGPDDQLPLDHTCDPPWFIVSRPMRKKKAKRWRSLLNR